ncbi:hypothetical protein ACX84U_32560, partial [Burkholderia pseudomallei]
MKAGERAGVALRRIPMIRRKMPEREGSGIMAARRVARRCATVRVRRVRQSFAAGAAPWLS